MFVSLVMSACIVAAVPTPVPTPVATPVHSPAVSSYDLQETVDGVNQTASIDEHSRTPVSETSSALPTDPSVTDGSISEHTDSFNEELDVLPPLESPENRFSDQRPPQHRRVTLFVCPFIPPPTVGTEW